MLEQSHANVTHAEADPDKFVSEVEVGFHGRQRGEANQEGQFTVDYVEREFVSGYLFAVLGSAFEWKLHGKESVVSFFVVAEPVLWS